MTTEGETNWEGLYQAGETGWDKGAPSPGLVDFLSSFRERPAGRVLVPGCGTGHDVRAWAGAGFEAVGLDVAPSAVRLARERTDPSLSAPSGGVGRASFRLGNFLTDDVGEPFDWVFEHTLYCAIQPGQRDEYVAAVSRSLKPGGQFLAVHYLIPDEAGPPFGTTREEVMARFSPFFERIEDWVPRSYEHRTNLELMVWWRRKPRVGVEL